MNIKNNLILALDVTDKDKAIEICKEVSPYINTIKIGYPLTLAEGLEIIKIIKNEFGANIICDYKVANIRRLPNSKICDLTFDEGADAIICHGFVGSDSVQACLDSANKHEKEIFLLTEMSHPVVKMFLQKDAEAIAKMGVDMGITNYVAPATRLDRLSEIRNIVKVMMPALFLQVSENRVEMLKKLLNLQVPLLLEEAFMNQIILHWPVKK